MQRACADKGADLRYQLHLQCSPKTRAGQVPTLTCSLLPLRVHTTFFYAACVGGWEGVWNTPTTSPFLGPGSRSHRLSPSDTQYTVAEGYMRPRSWRPGNSTAPNAIRTSGEVRPLSTALMSNTPLMNISSEGMAGRDSRDSPFSCNCHRFHENVCFQVYCRMFSLLSSVQQSTGTTSTPNDQSSVWSAEYTFN